MAFFRGFPAAEYRYTLMIAFCEIAGERFQKKVRDQDLKREELFAHDVLLDKVQTTG